MSPRKTRSASKPVVVKVDEPPAAPKATATTKKTGPAQSSAKAGTKAAAKSRATTKPTTTTTKATKTAAAKATAKAATAKPAAKKTAPNATAKPRAGAKAATTKSKPATTKPPAASRPRSNTVSARAKRPRDDSESDAPEPSPESESEQPAKATKAAPAKKRRVAAEVEPAPAPAPALPTVWINAVAYPHIIDSIVLLSDRAELIALRAVSRQLKVQADRQLTAHVAVEARDLIQDTGLRTPLARRIPSLCPKSIIRTSGRSARGGPFEHYDLSGLRVLDLVGRNWHGKMKSYVDLERLPLPAAVPTLRLRLGQGSITPVKEFREVSCTNLVILPTVHTSNIFVRPSPATERVAVALRYHKTGHWEEWNPAAFTFELERATRGVLRELVFAMVPYDLHHGQSRLHERVTAPWGVFNAVFKGFVDAVKLGVRVRFVGMPEEMPSDWLGLSAGLNYEAKTEGMCTALREALAEEEGVDASVLDNVFEHLDAYIEEIGPAQAELENTRGRNIDHTLEYAMLYKDDM